jgi:hypothetical protein
MLSRETIITMEDWTCSSCLKRRKVRGGTTRNRGRRCKYIWGKRVEASVCLSPTVVGKEKLMSQVDDPWVLDTSTDVLGMIFDDGGTLRPSLLGLEPQESGDGLPRSWYNDGTALRP